MTKTNKVSVRPAKTQISLGIRPVWSEASLSAWRNLWVLRYPLSAKRRLWSDWADAQIDLSLRWAHTHFVCFVKSWLTCSYFPINRPYSVIFVRKMRGSQIEERFCVCFVYCMTLTHSFQANIMTTMTAYFLFSWIVLPYYTSILLQFA